LKAPLDEKLNHAHPLFVYHELNHLTRARVFVQLKMSAPTDSCSICFGDVTAETGRVVTACSHLFHFRCLATWFISQDGASSCPCCRREVSELEDVPSAAADDAEADDDDSDYEEDEEESIFFIFSELDACLRAHGGTGATEALWREAFPGTDEEFTMEAAVNFTREELDHYALVQGGRRMTDATWDRLQAALSAEESSFLAVFALAQAEHTAAEAAAALASAPVEDPVREAVAAAVESAAEGPGTSVRVTWARQPDGEWQRQITVASPQRFHLFTSGRWGDSSAEPPPDELVALTTSAATRIQSAWRAFLARRKAKVDREMPTLILQAVRFIQARKIQAVWRGYKERHAVRANRGFRLLSVAAEAVAE
jgi:hypothetical protein